MHEIVVSISTNWGNRNNIIDRTAQWLRMEFGLQNISSIYEMPAINGRDADYLNAVAVCHTTMSITQILNKFKNFEVKMGRTPVSKIQGHIPLDLDLVIYDSVITSDKEYHRNYFQRGYQEIIEDKTYLHART